MSRIHSSAEAADHSVSTDVLVTWDQRATLSEIEETIKLGARNAVRRARQEHGE